MTNISVFCKFIGLVWDDLIFQARALAVQAVVVLVVVATAPEVQAVRDVWACYVKKIGIHTEIFTEYT